MKYYCRVMKTIEYDTEFEVEAEDEAEVHDKALDTAKLSADQPDAPNWRPRFWSETGEEDIHIIDIEEA